MLGRFIPTFEIAAIESPVPDISGLVVALSVTDTVNKRKSVECKDLEWAWNELSEQLEANHKK